MGKTEDTEILSSRPDEPKMSEKLSIGQLARGAGLGVETVRFYEREGLLPKPPRTQSGYRTYSAEALTRLEFIARAKQLGFSLNDVKELLRLSESPDATPRDFREAAMAKIDWIDGRMSQLKEMRSILADAIADSGSREFRDMCPILELFKERGTKGTS